MNWREVLTVALDVLLVLACLAVVVAGLAFLVAGCAAAGQDQAGFKLRDVAASLADISTRLSATAGRDVQQTTNEPWPLRILVTGAAMIGVMFAYTVAKRTRAYWALAGGRPKHPL